MIKKFILSVLIVLLAVTAAFAQRTVTGKVTSNDSPGGIPGVTVMISGTSLITTTNVDGIYRIENVPENATTVKFTFVGMKAKDLPIGNGIVNAVMEQDNKMLGVVDVSMYGITKKVSDVGAATSVGADIITKQTESNVMNSLQGSIAGVQISTATGQPGAPTTVRIRGISSVNSGSAPLYIVDGVPFNTGGYGMGYEEGLDPLSTINPADIENISILKDASATSIYGSRATNGVIVITTKRGKQGSSTFNVDIKVGVATPPTIKKGFKTVNVEDYKTFLWETYVNSRRSGYTTTKGEYFRLMSNPERVWNSINNTYSIDFTNGNMPAETDWWDAVTRTGVVQDYSFSANGGNEKVKYYASLNYFDLKGVVIATDLTRYQSRVNIDYAATSWLTMGVNLSGAYVQSNSTPNELAYANPVWSAGRMRPTDPIKKSDETWNMPVYNLRYNPVALYSDKYSDISYKQQYKAIFSPYLRFQLYKDLVFQSKFGLDFTNVTEKNVWSSTVNPQGMGLGGLTQMTDQRDATLTLTNTLNWMPSIGKNNFNLLLGQEIEQLDYSESYSNGTDFSDPSLTEIGNATNTEGFSGSSHAALSSVFANLEYDYDDRYYLSASIRGDGTSRFGENNKWGIFYSVGAKYRISAESFMSSTQKWLNNLNVRASYGTTGNQNVGYYVARASYGSSRYAQGKAIYPGALGAPDLKWESTDKFNVGLDFTIFNDLSIELDYYYSATRDLIFAIPLSRATGFSSQIANVGNLSNQGIELQLNATLLKRKNVQWTVSFNITTNENKILKLPTDDPIIGSSLRKLEVGLPVNSFYYYEYAGVDPATGHPRWYDDNGNYVYSFTQAKKRDLGSWDPKIYGGLSTRVNFYNFDFSMQFNYTYGNKLFVNDIRYRENDGAFEVDPPTYYLMDNRWRNPGDETTVPQLRLGGNNGADNFSSRELMDASYLRLRSIMLGYTIPSSILAKVNIKTLRAYISIDNLFTITKNKGMDAFRGFDPEAGLGGTQAANYPIAVNYALGINIGF
ncbi:MAG: TonB-dependent receptor [Bacteroidales bacterium]|jgi:TonB-linked SusC/RagA family outer membrane protein|nr:TonB-dependent receptor [Bacteroidales bacterium]